MSPLTFAMSTATRNYAQTSSYLIPGQQYLETFMPLSYSNRDHTFMGDYVIPVLKQQTRLLLCLTWRIIRSDIRRCLDCSDAHYAQAFSCYNSFSTQWLFLFFLLTRFAAQRYPLFWLPLNLHKNFSISRSISFISNNIARR